MNRSVKFLVFACVVGVCLTLFVMGKKYFYPQIYEKNQQGKYVRIDAPMVDTFPVSVETQIKIEYYYPDKNRILSEDVSCIPELLGCDKEQVVEYLNNYMQHISYAEQEEGLVSFELVSYNNHKICLRKTFRNNCFQGFIAKSFNGTIVILNGDGKTVYEYTDILTENLPEQLRIEIENGYRIENEEVLYSFLENYSS